MYNIWKVKVFTFLILLTLIIGCIDSKNNDNDTNQNQDDDIPDNNPDTDDEDPTEVHYSIERNYDDVRTYREVEYQITNASTESNISWNMGDGTILHGEKVIHFYRISDYFEIEVEILFDDKISYCSLQIPVRNTDVIDFYWTGDTDFIDLSDGSNDSVGVIVDEGISVPSVEVEMSVWNVIQGVEIGVEVRRRKEDSSGVIELLGKELVNSTIGETTFNWNFDSQFMEKFENDRPYSINFFYDLVETTGHARFYFEISIIY